jgi:hypothetical protein
MYPSHPERQRPAPSWPPFVEPLPKQGGYVIRWICNHPTAYVNITGAFYTVPYGVIAWGFYVQAIMLPLWLVLALGVLYNIVCTWARVRVSKPARRMDRQAAARDGITQYRSGYLSDMRHNRATYQMHEDDQSNGS